MIPTQPIYPLRTSKHYPVPPVCTAAWTEEDWERTAVHVTESETIETVVADPWNGTEIRRLHRAVGRNAAGELLYGPGTRVASAAERPPAVASAS